MAKKYEELVDWVKKQIFTREIKYGDKLMSEYELCDKFGISRQVVRRAINILKEENLVNSQRGSGTYVSCKLPEAKKKSNTIALATGNLNRYIFPRFLEGMEMVLAKNGYTMQLFLSQQSPTKEAYNLNHIMDTECADGIVIAPQRTGIPNPNKALYQKITQSKVPAVFFNGYFPDINIPYIGLDDYKVGKIATDYLCKAGHTNIAILAKTEDYQSHLRYSGYYDSLIENGCEFQIANAIWYDSLDRRYYDAFESKILSRIENQNFTAIFCYNDIMAVRVYETCKKYNIRVPEDLSIISVDDTDLAMLCDVKLTSIAHPLLEMGHKVGEAIITLIHGDAIENTMYEPTIIERDSVFNRNFNIQHL